MYKFNINVILFYFTSFYFTLFYFISLYFLDQNSELLRLLESEESLTASLQAEVAECRSELGKRREFILNNVLYFDMLNVCEY